jgi:hypothetical protein
MKAAKNLSFAGSPCRCLLLVWALLVCGAVGAFAADQTPKVTLKPTVVSGKQKAPVPVVKEEKIQVTGSRIGRKIQRQGYGSDTDLSVVVIDDKQIERSGSRFIEVLRKQSFTR